MEPQNSKERKKEYLSNLKVKDVTDSRKFWSTVKPFSLRQAKQ